MNPAVRTPPAAARDPVSCGIGPRAAELGRPEDLASTLNAAQSTYNGAQKEQGRVMWDTNSQCDRTARSRRSGVRRAGFTLIELMIVIGLIALITGITLPIFRGLGRRHEMTTCIHNMQVIGAALAQFRDDYRAYPPDAEESGGTGLGLFTLYYLTAYAQSTAPGSGPPGAGGHLVDTPGFKGGGYLRDVKYLHCPASPVTQPTFPQWNGSAWIPSPAETFPYLGVVSGGRIDPYNTYDLFYRRDQGARYGVDLGQCTLLDPYPPADTVVTWCIFHRSSPTDEVDSATKRVTDLSVIHPGDSVLVLCADGSVRRTPSPEPASYGVWLQPIAADAPPPDVAVTALSAPASAVQGDLVPVNVTAANPGASAETFTVTLTDTTDAAPIGAQTVTGLAPGASTTLSFTWNTGAASVGAHILQAQASAVAGETNLANNVRTAAVTILAAGQVMHVASIDMALKTARINTFALATVAIVDAGGNPVAGATVSGHWSGATSDSDVGGTDSAGRATLQSNNVRRRRAGSGTTFTFTVDNVARAGWSYNPAANVITSNSITVP